MYLDFRQLRLNFFVCIPVLVTLFVFFVSF